MDLQSIDEEQLQAITAELEPAEKAAFFKALEQEAAGSHDMQRKLRGLVYEREPPALEDFIFSKEYLGLPKGVIYPAIMDILHAVDAPDVREAFVCAGKGSGKSTLTSITMARQAWNVLCFRDPSAYFGLLPGALIAVVNMSIGADQAEKVMFQKLWQLIFNAQCFRIPGDNDPKSEKRIFKKLKRELKFPKQLYALSGHSDYKAYFGYDVFCGVLDECAWYRNKEGHDVSEEVYQGIVASCQTRFPSFYKILGISSPQAQDDFIMKRVDEGRNLGHRIEIHVDGDSYGKVVA